MSGKRSLWLLALCALYVGMMGAGTCGKQAQQQIDEAKQALDDAREAEAPTLANEEFRSAEESLLLAQDQYDDYRFRRAEETAATAEAQARLAQEKALASRGTMSEEERKQKEKEEAEKLAYNVSSLFDSSTIEQPTDEERARMALHDVHFAFDAFEISDTAQGVLALNAQWMLEHPGVDVEIEGHCDERGTEEYNLALGAKRAKVVYDFMLTQGVDASRMRTISYGESMPIDPSSTEEAYAKNRRAHFAVVQ